MEPVFSETVLILNTIEKAEAIVRKYPQLSYKVEDFKIRVEAPTENGFSVELLVKSEDFEVIYAVGHARFSLYFEIHPSDDYTIEAMKLLQEASALQQFVWGLSDQCRLKLISYGGSEPWMLIQERTGENWKTTGRTLLLHLRYHKLISDNATASLSFQQCGHWEPGPNRRGNFEAF